MDVKELPTITLAPPLVLTPSRGLDLRSLSVIPMVICLLIATGTAIHVWKLWQRVDKFYVEEAWPEGEEGGEEQRHEVTATIGGRDILVHEGRPDTPKSLIAARQGTWASRMKVGPEIGHRQSILPEGPRPTHIREATVIEGSQTHRKILSSLAREALSQRGISSPFTMRANMPYDIKDPAWSAGRNQEQKNHHHNRTLDSTQKPLSISVPHEPQLFSVLSQNQPTSLITGDAASYGSVDTWERNSSGTVDPSLDINNASAIPITLPQVQEDKNYDGGSLSLSAVDYSIIRRSIQSAELKTETDNTEYTVATSSMVRQSGIDWNDDESSLASTNFTRYSSGIGRNSYRDRFADY